jgi:hypothetical protein
MADGRVTPVEQDAAALVAMRVARMKVSVDERLR